MPPEVWTTLSSLGLPGLCIAGLIWYVLRRETSYETRLADLQKKLEEALTRRGDDAQRLASDALKLGDALDAQTRAFAELKEKLK